MGEDVAIHHILADASPVEISQLLPDLLAETKRKLKEKKQIQLKKITRKAVVKRVTPKMLQTFLTKEELN